MSLRLKLFSLVDAYVCPEHIRYRECVEGDTYAKLIPLLEGIHIVDWPFQFFDIDCRCMINYKLVGLNRVFSNVEVLPLAHPNLESKKPMCVVDLYFVYDSQQTLYCIVERAGI